EPAPVPVKKQPDPEPVETPRDVGQRRAPRPSVPEDRGQAGREMAREQVTEQLASVSGTLDQVLGDLSSSLASNDAGQSKVRQRGRRKTRGGRTAADLGSVASALPDLGAPAPGSSSIEGTRIGIESDRALVTEAWTESASGSGRTGAASPDLRPDASLLAVVRKYAPGIQFCYDNELEKRGGLGGKFVVSITVAAAGNVTDASVVKDTVGSAELARCALAQIETWRFPTIPEGVVTFQAPFVFTPPE
ncbi:MAG TPA: AgmX/PglI C-terminal domain-containing protein, partial [bacterium]|nr:AgmX/PglI C-terminal domain-containing protein [bacterium]